MPHRHPEGKVEPQQRRPVGGLNLAPSKFCAWKAVYGRMNEYNAWVSRVFTLEARRKRPPSRSMCAIQWASTGV